MISGLNTGGAEITLLRLFSRMDGVGYESRVLSLTGIGVIGARIRDLGVPVQALRMRSRSPSPSKFVQLRNWLRQGAPEIIQTWMYNADLAGGLAAQFADRAPVIWNVRHSNFVPDDRKGAAFWAAKACSYLSHWLPARIVCCSVASQVVHTQLGYRADKMVVIPNGIDVNVYKPDPEARLSVRRELQLSEETFLIGLVVRFHPPKDHHTFIAAAARLLERSPGVHFLLCGDEVE